MSALTNRTVQGTAHHPPASPVPAALPPATILVLNSSQSQPDQVIPPSFVEFSPSLHAPFDPTPSSSSSTTASSLPPRPTSSPLTLLPTSYQPDTPHVRSRHRPVQPAPLPSSLISRESTHDLPDSQLSEYQPTTLHPTTTLFSSSPARPPLSHPVLEPAPPLPAPRLSTVPTFGDLLDAAYLRWDNALDAIALKYKDVPISPPPRRLASPIDSPTSSTSSSRSSSLAPQDSASQYYQNLEDEDSSGVVVNLYEVLDVMVGGLMDDVESEYRGDETEGEGEAEVVFGAENEEEGKEEDVDLVLTQAPRPVKKEDRGEDEVQGIFGRKGKPTWCWVEEGTPSSSSVFSALMQHSASLTPALPYATHILLSLPPSPLFPTSFSTRPQPTGLTPLQRSVLSEKKEGQWVISFDWVRDCLRTGLRLPESAYEIRLPIEVSTDGIEEGGRGSGRPPDQPAQPDQRPHPQKAFDSSRFPSSTCQPRLGRSVSFSQPVPRQTTSFPVYRESKPLLPLAQAKPPKSKPTTRLPSPLSCASPLGINVNQSNSPVKNKAPPPSSNDQDSLHSSQPSPFLKRAKPKPIATLPPSKSVTITLSSILTNSSTTTKHTGKRPRPDDSSEHHQSASVPPSAASAAAAKPTISRRGPGQSRLARIPPLLSSIRTPPPPKKKIRVTKRTFRKSSSGGCDGVDGGERWRRSGGREGGDGWDVGDWQESLE